MSFDEEMSIEEEIVLIFLSETEKFEFLENHYNFSPPEVWT